MPEKTLERVIKKKVKPVVEGAIHRFLGVTIDEMNKDISDRIESAPLINYDINTALSFKAAKKLFKKQFLEKLIQTHYGNVSDVAKIVGLDRRSIHRAIKELSIDVDKCRKEMLKPGYFRKEAVDNILKKTFDTYKQIIHPDKLEMMYKNVSSLSADILKELPQRELTWKLAEAEFEKEYLKNALMRNQNNIATTAKKIKLRYETLLRKMKRLGIQNI